METPETANQEPEEEPVEEPVKEWNFDWPEGELFDQFDKASKLQGWVTLCTTNADVLGDLGFHLSGLM